MRYALLYNPIAGRGRAQAAAAEALAVLEAAGHEVIEGRSERAGHIQEMSGEFASEVDRLLVLGGDGSLREAATGLLESGRADRVAAGVLPLGTGNVVAREAGLPLDPVEAARALLAAEPWRIDVGWARAGDEDAEHLFLAMAGFGYDAAIAERIAAARSRPGSFGAGWYRRSADTLYGYLAAAEMLRLGVPRFGIRVDGKSVAERAAAAIVSNVRTYAKGMSMSPNARADDGHFDHHVRTSRAPWVTGAALLAAQLRRHAPRWSARGGTGTSAVIEGAGGALIPWQLDGDAMPRAARVSLRLVPGALTLLRAPGSGPAVARTGRSRRGTSDPRR